MDAASNHRFSGPVTVFHEKRLPEQATPVGYAALIDAYRLNVPWPRTLLAIGARHKIIEDGGWRILTPRHAPEPALEGHLKFAFKYEGLDLAILKRIFLALEPVAFEALVRAKPTGSYARRIWFLYEWLTGKTLNLPAADKGNYVPALDPEQQWGIDGENSPRHRVRNNMPGTPEFCPLVFRTRALDELAAMNLAESARAIAGQIPRDLLARTAAFLLLKDSRPATSSRASDRSGPRSSLGPRDWRGGPGASRHR